MSLQTYKGTLAAPVGTGDTAVTGVGFQPKALIAWVEKPTADVTFTANADVALGFASSSSAWVGASKYEADAQPTVRSGVKNYNTALFDVISTAGASAFTATLGSFDADGFTINTTVAAPAAWIIHYLAIGGTDVTNALASSFTTQAGTGDQPVTGVGFQPDLLLFIGTSQATLGTAGTTGRWHIGATDGVGQGCLATRSVDLSDPSQVIQYQRTDKCFAQVSGTAVQAECTIVSMDTDGFTVNWTTAVTGHYVLYLALKGGHYKVTSDTQKTSTGTKAKTGVGFQPTGLLTFGGNAVANAAADLTKLEISIGATDGVREGCTWAGATDNVATSVAKSRSDAGKTLVHATEPSTVDAAADISSFDADGYTLNWSSADAVAREFISVVFGQTPTAILKPSADSVDGAWTDNAAGTALAAAIDEDDASDADYIQSEDNPVDSRCRVKLSTAPDPGLSTGHIIYWRAKKDTGGTVNMKVTLRQGGGNSIGAGTLIAEFTRNDVPSTFTTYTETLSGAEADTITNYSDLYLEFYADIP